MAVTCWTRKPRIDSGSSTGAAVTLATSARLGGGMSTSARASAMTSAAGAISEQWNGALTGSMMARRAPLSAAISTARSTAARWPLGTTWPGALSLAGAQTSSSAAASATSRATSRSRPMSAAMAPSPTGTACCMAWPRRLTRRTASATEKAPVAASAEYSPMEWPATKRPFSGRRMPPSRSSTRTTARLTATIAGWAFSVSISSSSGPSNMSLERRWARASSTSSKSSRAAGWAAARAAPMPTACDAWPGNTKARFIAV